MKTNLAREEALKRLQLLEAQRRALELEQEEEEEEYSEEPYYNWAERGLKRVGKAIEGTPIEKGLQLWNEYITIPAGQLARSGFEALVGDRDRGYSQKPLSEKFPERFSSDPAEYQDPLIWQKGGPFDKSSAEIVQEAGGFLGDTAAGYGIGKGIGAFRRAPSIDPPGKINKPFGSLGEAEEAYLKTKKQAVTPEGKGAATAPIQAADDEAREALKVAEKRAKDIDPLRSGLDAVADSPLGSAKRDAYDPFFTQAKEIAKREGIDPNLIEANDGLRFKPGTTHNVGYYDDLIKPGERAAQMTMAHNEGLRQTSEAFKNRLKSLSGGEVLDQVQAGDLIRNAIPSKLKRLQQEADFTYSTMRSQLPVNKMSPSAVSSFKANIARIEKELLKDARNPLIGAVNSQYSSIADGLASALAAQRKTVARNSYDTMLERMREVGRAIELENRKSIWDGVNPYKDRLYEIYDAYRDAFYKTAEDFVGKEALTALKANNEKFTEFFNSIKELRKIAGNDDIAGESIFQNAVKSANSKRLEQLQSLFNDDPTSLGKLTASYLDAVTRDSASGTISFAQMGNVLRNSDKAQRVIQSLVGPEEFSRLHDIIRLGERMGSSIKANPSGSGAYLGRNQLAPRTLSELVVEPSMRGLKESQRASAVRSAKRASGEKVPYTAGEAAAKVAGAAFDTLSNAPGNVLKGAGKVAEVVTKPESLTLMSQLNQIKQEEQNRRSKKINQILNDYDKVKNKFFSDNQARDAFLESK